LLEQAHTPLVDFSADGPSERQSITPDEISVGELKAAARLIMQDIRDTPRAVVITEESGNPIGILLSPHEFGRLLRHRSDRTEPSQQGALRDRLAQRFPARVRVHSDPGSGRMTA
jgi:hypothetical protein